MTTTEMEYSIAKYWNPRVNLIVPNVSWGLLTYEADMLIVRKTGYCIEVEIKRTYSDYLNDFRKRKWKRSNGGQGKLIKEFYYAFPKRLWNTRKADILDKLPDFAGVMLCHDTTTCEIVIPATPNRQARALREKEMFQVARLGTLRIWTLKHTIICNQK